MDNEEEVEAYLQRLDEDAVNRVGHLEPVEASAFLSILDDIEMTEAGFHDSGASFCGASRLLDEIDSMPLPDAARGYLRERATCAPDAPCRADGTHNELADLGKLPDWLR